jgi:steroid 5-alpha reductase family enzyme
MLPASYLLDRSAAPGFGAWAVAGGAVWLAGLLIESVADAPKSPIRARDGNRGRFIASGLWRYSRHPNASAKCSSGCAMFPATPDKEKARKCGPFV